MNRDRNPKLNITGKQVLYMHNYLQNALKDHPASGWLWGRIAHTINGTSIRLCNLTEDQIDILDSAYDMLERCRGPWSKTTRRAARRQRKKIETWRGVSAIDRLGDLV